jgi:NAD(P)H-hydrate epimerase
VAVSRLRYVTAGGLEVPAVTAPEMRAIDRIAVEETGPNLFQMMENAGRNLALQAIEVLGPDWRRRHTLVLAGGGGNGGGICAARHLANRGATVTLVLAAPLAAGGVPAFQQHVYASTSGRQIKADAVRRERPDLLIDALIGYGLTTAPQGIAADLITWANGTGAPILSLDVPSSVDATTGDTRRGDPAAVDDDAGAAENRTPPGGCRTARARRHRHSGGSLSSRRTRVCQPLRRPIPDSPDDLLTTRLASATCLS